MEMRAKSPALHTRPEVLLRRALSRALFAIGSSVKIQPTWQQPTWFIDPQNVTGLAADTNSGLTSSTPVLTWQKGVIAKMGTFSPRLRQNTTFQFLSSHTNNSDPVIFRPFIENGAVVIIRGDTLGNVGAPQIATGVLSAVAAKNRATPQALNATLGGGATGQLLVNSTRNARCWIDRNTAGTTFNLSQPFTPATLPLNAFTGITQNNAFANNDVWTTFQPTRINLVDIRPVIVDFNAASTNLLQIYQCQGFDPSAGGAFGNALYLNDQVAVVEAQMLRIVNVVDSQNAGGLTTAAIFFNCSGGAISSHNCLAIVGGPGAGVESGNNIAPVAVIGGVIGATNFPGAVWLDSDVIVGAASVIGGGQLGLVMIDTGVTLSVTRDTDARTTANTLASSIIVWGAGTIDVKGSSVMALIAGAGAAAAEFPSAGFTLRLNGGTTGVSHTNAQPDVLNGAVALTPATLDAAAGAAGFAGEAFNLSGGAYRKLSL
jgi:hypothetical protein